MTITTTHEPQTALDAIEGAQAVIAYDLSGRIQDVNANFLELCGYRRDDLIGQPLTMLSDPNDPSRKTRDAFVGALRQAQAQTGVFRYLNRDGRPFWLHAAHVPMKGADGGVDRIVCYGMDLTAIYQDLRDANATSRAISRSQAVIRFTPTGEIIEANDNFLGALGYGLDEIQGRHHAMFCDIAYAQSPEYRQFWADLAAGRYQAGEFRRLGKGGKEIWIVASYNPVIDDNGKVASVIKYATDVTARKKAVNELIDGLGKLASGDLTPRISGAVTDEFLSVRDSFNTTLEAFTRLVEEIREQAEAMNTEAGEIARGAGDLARRGESQAASLEQTAAAVEQISGNITMTSESAAEADAAARDAQNVVLKGAEVVGQAIAAIERIDEHTKQMGEFTRVIEGFAFQTNLLSINAAVEAARAGEVGRGFAVVANEVRNLAQQSAKASQSIADLISKSETEVKAGVKLVRDAGVSLEQIRSAVNGMVENIAGIAHATSEQSTGVREVSQALSQLDGVNQANLSMSEQYATAAAALSSQVEDLGAMMERFDTGSEAASQRGAYDRKPGRRVA